MDTEIEVEAYASADAQAYLNALDDAFVGQIAALGIDEGTVLDVGTGPGSIPVKLSQRRPRLRVIGVDRSHNMLRVAEAAAARAGLGARVAFLLADASRLCFPDHTFDLIISNSLLHHLSHPGKALDEIARIARPRGKVLLRDLSRPSRLAFSIHAAWYGRHYSGRMKQLYEDSLRAAYTRAEIRSLLDASPLRTARVIRDGRTHFAVLWENKSSGARRA